MKFTLKGFRAWKNKSITLLGMSGVGKTRLAHLLMQHNWFHYSIDYRIGTRYLDEPILDNIKQQAMQIPFLRDLLRSDSIYMCNNITVQNLKPVSSFLGNLGDPEQGGLPLREFKRRQELHRLAEIAALKEVPDFIRKAQTIYGYPHMINDAGGSVCELDDSDVLDILDKYTFVLYIKATKKDKKLLMQRAERDPKPLYYREAFIEQQLAEYMRKQAIPYVAMINPDAFVRWIFPKLLDTRMPRYESIAKKFGYTVTTEELSCVTDEKSFLHLLEHAIERKLSN